MISPFTSERPTYTRSFRRPAARAVVATSEQARRAMAVEEAAFTLGVILATWLGAVAIDLALGLY